MPGRFEHDSATDLTIWCLFDIGLAVRPGTEKGEVLPEPVLKVSFSTFLRDTLII